MNKIYQLVSEVDNTTPLVSNVIVSDIKDDINRAVTLGTFTSRGLEYKVMAKGANASNATTITETEYNALNNDDVLNGTDTTNNNHGSKLIGNTYKVQPTDAAKKPFYVMCNYNKTDQKYIFETIPGQTLTHFDLILYPFKGTTNLNSKKEFVKSFTFDDSNVAEILTSIEDNKTLSHNIITPDKSELACIKNYYKLRAKINTVRKVGAIEQANILTNVYTKLFEHFNMRQMDFGEEIPYDTLLSVMENADPRIKNISLDEPELTTKF
jgi:hypothetical protein